MLVGDFATMPAIPMGYPITVTCSPGALGDLANGRIGRPRRTSEFGARRMARSEVFETAAGERLTGVGDPGKKITRLSSEAEAPRCSRASDSPSPAHGPAPRRVGAGRRAP